MSAISLQPYQTTKARLLMLAPDGSIVQEFVLQGHCVVVGRSPQSDLVVSSVDVSRFHAQIILQGRNCLIIDMDSTNGTYLNGARLPPRQKFELLSSDQINLGRVTFLFQIVATSIPSPQASINPQQLHQRQQRVGPLDPRQNSGIASLKRDQSRPPESGHYRYHSPKAKTTSPPLMAESNRSGLQSDLLTDSKPASAEIIECQEIEADQVYSLSAHSSNFDQTRNAKDIIKFEVIPFSKPRLSNAGRSSVRRFVATDTDRLEDFYYPKAEPLDFGEEIEYTGVDEGAFQALRFQDEPDYHLREVFQKATNSPFKSLQEFGQKLLTSIRRKMGEGISGLQNSSSKHSLAAWLFLVFGATALIAFRNMGVFG